MGKRANKTITGDSLGAVRLGPELGEEVENTFGDRPTQCQETANLSRGEVCNE
jgi:hypothetical protein